MLTVAIASENDVYDAEVYRALLALLLAREVRRWPTDMRFNGYRSVWKLAPTFLDRAASANVAHALLAVDNDGGAKRSPEHEDTHHAATDGIDEDACRVCWLAGAVPPLWHASDRRRCIAVPVQALETWLLCLRGDSLVPSPEQCYHRDVLKRRFFGGGALPPVEKRKELALAQLARPDALERLRERRSFRHFASQLSDWR